ncbi:MAG TPA: hypothetical protein VGM28_03125 [Candidatus Limnocylindrales bacterium]
MFNVGPGEIIILAILALMMGLPVLVLVIVVRSMRRGPPEPVPWAPSAGSPMSALDARTVLAERLARADITEDEFHTAMRALGIADSAD